MKSNTIIIIVATIIVGLGIFWYYSTSTGNDQPLTLISAENKSQARFQTLLGQLKQISFDTKIFTDSRFMSLVDIKSEITPESAGRLDPFAIVH